MLDQFHSLTLPLGISSLHWELLGLPSPIVFWSTLNDGISHVIQSNASYSSRKFGQGIREVT